jgi:hypothetical protein
MKLYDRLHWKKERLVAGCELIEVGSADSRERWTAARARHHAWHERARPGSADGTKRALRAAQGCTLLCMAAGCESLVHLQSARRHARAFNRASFALGDGCANRLCTRSHAQPRHIACTQAGTASALLEPDGNTLVLWPSTVHTRVNLWAVPPSLMGGVELRHIVRMARGL